MPQVVAQKFGGTSLATDTLLALAKQSAELGGRSHDLIASCGEIISAVVFSQVLKSSGIDAIPLTSAQAGSVCCNTDF